MRKALPLSDAPVASEQLELDFKRAVIELAESDLAGAIRELTETLRTQFNSPLAHSPESLRNVLYRIATVHQELADLWLPVNLPRRDGDHESPVP